MDYKIVFSDIDGTLLNRERKLSETTITEIKKLKDKIPFILISARMPAAMRHLQKELGIEDLPIICYNGGLVLHGNQELSSTVIPMEILEDLTAMNKKTGCHLSLYHNDEWYVPQMDQWAKREINNTQITPEVKENIEVIEKWKSENKGAHKIMAMGDEAQIDQIRDYLQKNYPEELHLYRSKNTYLEIANKKISKFSGIELLLKQRYNYSTSQAIAIGDNYNDVEMLRRIGYGIAVGNGRQEAIDVANYVSEKSIDDGVAKSLIKIFNL